MEFSVVISIIFIFAAVHSGESIQCYSCSTKGDPTCMQGDKLESFKVECNSKALDDGKKSVNTGLQLGNDVLNKIGFNLGKAGAIDADIVCQKVDFEDRDQKYTVRTCSIAKKDSESMCDMMKKQLHSDTLKISHCSQCTESLCNSSNGIIPALYTTFITLAIVMLYNQ